MPRHCGTIARSPHTLKFMWVLKSCCWALQTDLKGLSGGERSYSTLAFTMALENVISVPFCCLDEFDVVCG